MRLRSVITERERIAHLTTDEHGQAVLVVDATGEALGICGTTSAGAVFGQSARGSFGALHNKKRGCLHARGYL